MQDLEKAHELQFQTYAMTVMLVSHRRLARGAIAPPTSKKMHQKFSG